MNRRTILAAPLAALGFLVSPFQKRLQSPICGETIGKPISAVLSSNFCLEPVFESGLYSPYVSFPIENVVTVEYEKGIETWVTFNMPIEDAANFTMREFLTSKLSRPTSSCFPGDLLYRRSKFRMSSLSLKDGVTGEEADRINKASLS